MKLNVALTPQQHLRRLGHMVQGEGGVFLASLAQRFTQLDVVLAVLGHHRHRVERRRRVGPSLGLDGTLSEQNRAGAPSFELGERHHVTGTGLVHALFGELGLGAVLHVADAYAGQRVAVLERAAPYPDE